MPRAESHFPSYISFPPMYVGFLLMCGKNNNNNPQNRPNLIYEGVLVWGLIMNRKKASRLQKMELNFSFRLENWQEIYKQTPLVVSSFIPKNLNKVKIPLIFSWADETEAKGWEKNPSSSDSFNNAEPHMENLLPLVISLQEKNILPPQKASISSFESLKFAPISSFEPLKFIRI